jgi:hypothetical protein
MTDAPNTITLSIITRCFRFLGMVDGLSKLHSRLVLHMFLVSNISAFLELILVPVAACNMSTERISLMQCSWAVMGTTNIV